MEKIKLSKSIKKYLRSEKSRIRKMFLDPVERIKALEQSLKKIGLFVNEKKQLEKIVREKIEKPKKDKIKKKVVAKKDVKKEVKKISKEKTSKKSPAKPKK